eukprot:m.386647 g.386647  ORF g.386647 m.386647 type:complete len:926 (+) comp21019_c0_seq1:200-2977(+)
MSTSGRHSGRGGKKQIVCNLQHCQYVIVHRCVRECGWKIAKKGESWDVAISDNNQSIKALVHMRTHPRSLTPVQRVNHFPNMKQLYLKDCLAKNMGALYAELGSRVHPVTPLSWTLPSQYSELEKYLKGINSPSGPPVASDAVGSGNVVFIVKPAAGLQGHGISVTTDPLAASAARTGKNTVVQHYIDPPMLLDGFKFDLRLYVLISSLDPLKIYLFNDGLVRLCTTPYCSPTTSKSMKNRNAHLTNYSLNKKSKNFVKGPDGSKRSLKTVFDQLAAEGADVDAIWNDIVDVINTSVVGVQPQLNAAYQAVIAKRSPLKTSCSTCYEILGFDVMLDAAHKAWLIEVNHAPSFRGGSKVDNRIKTSVMRQALRLLNVSEKRKRLLVARTRKEWEKYMREQAGCVPTPPSRRKAAMDTTGTSTDVDCARTESDGPAPTAGGRAERQRAAPLGGHKDHDVTPQGRSGGRAGGSRERLSRNGNTCPRAGAADGTTTVRLRVRQGAGSPKAPGRRQRDNAPHALPGGRSRSTQGEPPSTGPNNTDIGGGGTVLSRPCAPSVCVGTKVRACVRQGSARRRGGAGMMAARAHGHTVSDHALPRSAPPTETLPRLSTPWRLPAAVSFSTSTVTSSTQEWTDIAHVQAATDTTYQRVQSEPGSSVTFSTDDGGDYTNTEDFPSKALDATDAIFPGSYDDGRAAAEVGTEGGGESFTARATAMDDGGGDWEDATTSADDSEPDSGDELLESDGGDSDANGDGSVVDATTADGHATDGACERMLFRAPTCSDPDEFVRIFSSQSRSNRTHYADVAAAADKVAAKHCKHTASTLQTRCSHTVHNTASRDACVAAPAGDNAVSACRSMSTGCIATTDANGHGSVGPTSRAGASATCTTETTALLPRRPRRASVGAMVSRPKTNVGVVGSYSASIPTSS